MSTLAVFGYPNSLVRIAGAGTAVCLPSGPGTGLRRRRPP
jgi:hypothetical protein